MKKVAAIVMGLGVLLALATPGSAWVMIETVTVGDPNNVDDTAHDPNGFGGVAYEYNIGKFEITAGQYCEFLNAVGDADPYGLYSTSMDSDPWGCQITRKGSSPNYTYDFSGRPSGTEADWMNRPVNYVSWGDAARFANWLHNGQPTGPQGLSTTEDGAYYLNGATGDPALVAVTREPDWKWAITSEDEWYKAAYYDPNKPGGAGYWDYPTQTNSTPNNGNPEGDTGNSGNFDDGDYTIGSPYWRTNVGFFGQSDSPYGTLDQGGNVWEWNEALIPDQYGTGWYGGLRGGAFIDGVWALRASERGLNGRTDGSYNFGFRVSEVPEPTCLVVVALGGLALLRRRR